MRAAAFSSGARSRLNTVSVRAKESRIGSKPIPVPKGVTVDLKGSLLKVKVGRRAWGPARRTLAPRTVLTSPSTTRRAPRASWS